MSTATTWPDDAGRLSAMMAYGFYILSIPSAGLFALVGLIIAYLGRGGSGLIPRSHLSAAIHIWWTAFWWAVVLGLLCVIGVLLIPVLIGFLILWLAGLIGLIVAIWFTVKSVLGLLALLDGRPA